MLLTTARCYKAGAWLVIPYFLFQAYVSLNAFGNEALWAVMLTAVYCFFAFLTLTAIGEGIMLFIDLEDNTRRQADKAGHVHAPAAVGVPVGVCPVTE